MDENDVIARLRALGSEPVDPAVQSADLTAMATATVRGPRWTKLRVAAAFLAGLLVGGTGLAAADALPDPAQRVAHTVLGGVGVDVPNPERYYGPECGPEEKKNHGAYVRDDHSLATTDCGKPIDAVDESDEPAGTEAPDDESGKDKGKGKGPVAASDPCQGPPPWAVDKTMTDEEKAAAKTQRATLCGTDADELEAEGTEAPETEAPQTEAPAVEDEDGASADHRKDDEAKAGQDDQGDADEETTTTTAG